MLKNGRKIIASSIAATMILGMVPNNAYAEFVSKDIHNHWAKSQICVMQEKGYIGGYPDGCFKPNKEITRAEFVSILNKLFGYNKKSEMKVSDVHNSDWYYDSISIALESGYIGGYPDGTFKPNKAITRQEAASVIAKIKNLAPSKNSRKTDSFKDKDKIAKWSKSGIDAVVELGYMSGYPDGTFRPNQPMTRAEVVALLSRFLDSKSSDQTQIKNNEEIKPKVEAKTDATTNSSKSGGNGSSSSSNNSNNKVNPFSNKGTFNSNYDLSTSDSVTYGNNEVSTINGNVAIKGDLASSKVINLDNLEINGKLTIDVKDGHVNLNNTKVNQIEIVSCGSNSMQFNGKSSANNISILDGDGVRIFVNGDNAVIGNIEIAPSIDNSEIQLDGNFAKSEIKILKPTKIKLKKYTKVNKVVIASEAVFISDSKKELNAEELSNIFNNFEADKKASQSTKKLSEEINKIKNNKKEDKNKDVNIPNEYLKKAINKELGRSLDQKITQKDLESLKKLSSDFLSMDVDEDSYKSRGISDLTGLEYAVNLEWVDLSENSISDLSPLRNSVNIKWLELDRNKISDLKPLSNIKKLEHLNIYNNAGIMDLKPIAGLTELKWIDMHHCSRGKDPLNVEELVTLKKLEYLSIETNLVDDVSFVKELPNLTTFSCNNTFVTDLGPVQDLAAQAYDNWSGSHFLNMYGQMLKSPVVVNLNSNDTEYRFKSPVKNNEKYKARVEEVAASYGEEVKVPGFEVYGEQQEFVQVSFDHNTDEVVLKFDPNTSGSERKFMTKVLLDYGMYSLKLEFDITQIDSSSTEKALKEYKNKNGEIIASLYEDGKLIVKSGVQEIPKGMFEKNKDIKKVILPNSVKTIGKDSFTDCQNLESIVIPEGVELIDEYAFYKCYKLNNVELPTSLKQLNYCAFGSCKALENLTIKEGIEEIGYSAFLDCKSLKSVTIPASVKSIQEWPFSGCDNLENFIVDSNNKYYSEIDGILYDKSGTILIQYLKSHGGHYTIPEGVVQIAKGAFVDTGIETVTMPESLKIVGFSAFEGCEDLIDVDVPKNVKELDHFAFAYNSNLENIKLPEGLEIIRNNVFNGCEKLKSIVIPNTVTSIGNNTFENCTGLTEINIPNSVTSIGERTFEGCSELKVVRIDNIKANVTLGEKCIPKNVEIKYLRETGNTDESSENIVMSDEVRAFYIKTFNKYSKSDKKYANIVDDKASSYQELPENHIFTKSDMEMLKKFYTSDVSVTDELVSPLQYATNLEDFEVLFYGKDNLRELENFEVLKNCKKLKVLYYLNNGLDVKTDDKSQLNDISAVSELLNLEDLRINMTNLEDITPVSKLQLKTLVVTDNKISELNSAIEGMETLERLDVENNKISDISSMSSLKNLRSTYLYNNNISDISPVLGLDKLEALLINGNNIDDISGLKDMNLKRLYVNENPLNNNYIDILKQISSINTLKVGNISVDDFEWMKQSALRAEGSLSDLEENNARLYTFGNIDLEIESDKSLISEGVLTIKNPLKGLCDEALLQDGEAENQNEALIFEGDDIKIKLDDLTQEYLEIKYPIYSEDPNTVFGEYAQAASIAGQITLKITLK